MSGVGGAYFKGNPEETERKYQLARELQLSGAFLRDACREVGISTVYYRKIMREKGDESLANRGDRNASNIDGTSFSTVIIDEEMNYNDPLWDRDST